MATRNTLVTRASIINDFLTRVRGFLLRENVANDIFAKYHFNFLPPRAYTRMWDNGTTVAYSLGYTTARLTELGSNVYTNPTTADLPGPVIRASEIINLCRYHASQTTRFRWIVHGVLYSQYYNYQYTQTGLPADNWIIPFYTGTLAYGINFGHLTNAYIITNFKLDTNSRPQSNTLISADAINTYYDNLALDVRNARDALGIVDIRVCHSSCHNNCHGSRGRR